MREKVHASRGRGKRERILKQTPCYFWSSFLNGMEECICQINGHKPRTWGCRALLQLRPHIWHSWNWLGLLPPSSLWSFSGVHPFAAGSTLAVKQKYDSKNISSSLQYWGVALISATPHSWNAVLFWGYYIGLGWGWARCGVSCFCLAFPTVITLMLHGEEVMWGLVPLPGMSIPTTHLGMREMATSESRDSEDSPWVGSFQESICSHSNEGTFMSQVIGWPLTLCTKGIPVSAMARVTLSLAHDLKCASSMATLAPRAMLSLTSPLFMKSVN